MRIPGASQLLDIWERAQLLPLPARMLLLLAAADAETEGNELDALSIGRRNALLLDLRERLFGSELGIVAQCPSCGGDLEMNVATAQLRAAPASEKDLSVEMEGYRACFRPPASRDLLSIVRERPTDAPLALFKRCLISLHAPDGTEIVGAVPPSSVIAAIDARMAKADPQADMRFETVCPACSQVWQPVFDVANFLWQEIHAWAKDTLRTVHSLARAYGWRESDVLSLSATRRLIYLEMARS